MAPRRGIGGVTVENVANVGRYGSQAMPQRSPFAMSTTNERLQAFSEPFRSFNPQRTRPVLTPPVEVPELDLFGRVSATAGEKYAGFPTQSAWQNAIAGRAYNLLEQANLAEQMAARNALESGLGFTEAFGDIQAGLRGITAPSPADDAIRAFGGTPVADTRTDFTPAEAIETMDYLRQLARQAGEMVEQKRTNVDPYLNLADQVLQYSPAQLAREIATRQYGMDPNLAYGTFTDGFSADYYNEQRNLDLAQRQYNRMLGGFAPASMEETIFDLYGPQGIADYQQKRAESALGLDEASRLKEQENELSGRNDAMDAELAQVYLGMTPKTISSNVDKATIRNVMNNEEFATAFNTLVQEFGVEDQSINRTELRQKINARALQIYGPTVQATVLADLIYNWSLAGA